MKSFIHYQMGHEFISPREIEKVEHDIFINEFKLSNNQISLDVKQFFYNDVEEYLKSKDISVIVTQKNRYKQLFKEQNSLDIELIDNWKNIKATNEMQPKSNFEEQLVREYNGVLIALKTKLKELTNKESDVQSFINLLYNFSRILDINKDGLNIDRFKIVIEFLQSEYYRKIPYVDIDSKLIAYHLCKGKILKITKSDLFDIKLISSYLPFVNIFICDKSKADTCKKLNFHKTYYTQIYSIADFDKIMGFLNSL